MAPPERPLAVGVVARAQGLRGEVSVRLFNPGSSLWTGGLRLWAGRLDGGSGSWLTIERIAPGPRGAIVKFVGVGDREAASALAGVELWVGRSVLPAVEIDEVYLMDLIGLSVKDVSGRVVGRVTGVESAGKRDFLVVEEGSSRQLIPLETEILVAVEVALGWLQVGLDLTLERSVVGGEGQER